MAPGAECSVGFVLLQTSVFKNEMYNFTEAQQFGCPISIADILKSGRRGICGVSFVLKTAFQIRVSPSDSLHSGQ